MTHFDLYAQDWLVFASTFAFLVGVASTISCARIVDTHSCEEQLKTLSAKVDKMQEMYQADMMTLLRETLQQPAFDNNSIPAGE
jgi:hypothetical protein